MKQSKVKDYKQVPIIINNFNRYDKLLILLDGLEKRGYRNIWIIDNASTYPPLLEWYRTCPYKVILLHENVGHISIFKTGLFKVFRSSYYAYTDSDLEISEECPDDFMEKFITLLKKHPRAVKAGFALRLDDLPDHYDKKKEVVEWESQFWEKEVEPGVYNAPIDTTFAVYKPWFKGGLVEFSDLHFRVGPPYTMRHLPWYMDSRNPTGEDLYYLSRISTSTHWSEKDKKTN
ncbi:MAG: glycosyltransferase [Candidatus Cryptobacteroides sp.]